MEITYIVVVSLITFVIAELLKVMHIDAKYIPITNIGIGILVSLICYFAGILPAGSPLLFIEALVLCIIHRAARADFMMCCTPKSQINRYRRLAIRKPLSYMANRTMKWKMHR